MDVCFLTWSTAGKLLSGGKDLLTSNVPLWCNSNFKERYNNPDTFWWMAKEIIQVYVKGTFFYLLLMF